MRLRQRSDATRRAFSHRDFPMRFYTSARHWNTKGLRTSLLKMHIREFWSNSCILIVSFTIYLWVHEWNDSRWYYIDIDQIVRISFQRSIYIRYIRINLIILIEVIKLSYFNSVSYLKKLYYKDRYYKKIEIKKG